MIDKTAYAQNAMLAPAVPSQAPRRVLHMVEGERTAGSMPVWEMADSPRDNVQARLSEAAGGGGHDVAALAYREAQKTDAEKPFGFYDLLDMVNPLQHVPLVNYAYRAISGDTIKPASQVIGGALFGGPAGAAVGIVNAVMAEETGRDAGEHALAFVTNGEIPKFKASRVENAESFAAADEVLIWNNPDVREVLPGTVIAMANLSYAAPKTPIYND